MANITITWSIALLIIGALVSVGAIALGKSRQTRKIFGWIGGVTVVLMFLAILMANSLPTQFAFLNNPIFGKSVTFGDTTITYTTVQQPGQAIPVSGACAYQPTSTYTTKDKFSSLIIGGGTAYYKANGLPATTTSISNLNRGTEYIYWYSNATTYVKPETKVANCGANDFVADAWQNATITLTGYDNVANKDIGAGVNNISMGANAQANIKVTYQGTAKKSAMPFGGLMVVEYNSTISDVTCTGSVLRSGNPSNFHLTFSPSTTNHVSRSFEVGPEIDDGTGSSRTIECQILNGATAQGNTAQYFRFIPANYYLTNDGDFVLDVEKNANQDNARTGMGTRSLTIYWAT